MYQSCNDHYPYAFTQIHIPPEFMLESSNFLPVLNVFVGQQPWQALSSIIYNEVLGQNLKTILWRSLRNIKRSSSHLWVPSQWALKYSLACHDFSFDSYHSHLISHFEHDHFTTFAYHWQMGRLVKLTSIVRARIKVCQNPSTFPKRIATNWALVWKRHSNITIA